MSRVTTVTPLGLVTEPNQFGQYPVGALRQAYNVCIRKPGILEPFPALTNYRSAALSSGYTFLKMWAGASGVFGVAYDGNSLYELRRVTTGGSTAIDYPELDDFSVAAGKAHMASHRGRYYFTSDQGVLALESESATEAFLAGFPPPRSIEIDDIITTGAQAIPDDKRVAYRAVFSRQGADGSYVKIGPPSYILQLDNEAGGTRDFVLKVGWPYSLGPNLREGDHVELYRTATQDLATDPGDVFLLAKTAVIDATDIFNSYVLVQDSTPDSGLGAALYTNEGEEGPTAAKYPPPLADDVVVFKGHTFYAASKLTGYLDMRVPGTWGTGLSSAAQKTHGIGVRTISGDTTSGSTTLSDITDMTGIVPGQVLDDLNAGAVIPVGTTVVSVNVGASTLVMSNQALLTLNNWVIEVEDRIEVNGEVVTAAHPQLMVTDLSATNSAQFTFGDALRRSNTSVINLTGLEFRVESPFYYDGVPTLRATNGQNYDPPLPDLDETPLSGANDERYNRLLWSELDQPEAVPQSNELLVGAGTIHRLIATTDAIYVWCSDGLYRVSGEAPDWRVDPIDPTLVLSGRNCLDIAKQVIWAQTNRGLVALSESSGIQEVSTGIIGDLRSNYSDTWNKWLTCDESTNEVWVHQGVVLVGTVAAVFNTLTKAYTSLIFSTMSASAPETVSASTYLPSLPGIVWGNVDAGTTDVRKFHATTKCEGAIVTHQPITGDGDPFTSKNWIDCAWLMRVPTSTITVLPTMNGTEFDGSVLVNIPAGTNNTLDSRGVAAIGLNAAFGSSIEVGWRLTTNATQAWQFRGLSLRYRLATEQGPVR